MMEFFGQVLVPLTDAMIRDGCTRPVLKSSDFVRIEKYFDSPTGGGYDVYEFHSVLAKKTRYGIEEGIKYIAHYEERIDLSGQRYRGPGYRNLKCTKDDGNRMYLELKSKGYEFAGRWEMNVLGYKRQKQ